MEAHCPRTHQNIPCNVTKFKHITRKESETIIKSRRVSCFFVVSLHTFALFMFLLLFLFLFLLRLFAALLFCSLSAVSYIFNYANMRVGSIVEQQQQYQQKLFKRQCMTTARGSRSLANVHIFSSFVRFGRTHFSICQTVK